LLLLLLLSLSTLFAFAIVDLSVAVRARYATGRGTPKWRVLAPSALVVAGSCLVAFPFFYQIHWGVILAGGVLFVAGTAGFYTLPVVYRPEGFAVPLNPFLPCLGTLANIFLIGKPLQQGSTSLLRCVNLKCSRQTVKASATSILLRHFLCRCCTKVPL
jgi:hypothetical protein